MIHSTYNVMAYALKDFQFVKNERETNEKENDRFSRNKNHKWKLFKNREK